MNPLDLLISKDFRVAIGCANSPQVLRRALIKREELRKVQQALREGRITEETIKDFVEGLMQNFQRGVQFPHELTLAALAVVLESRWTQFADDYLFDLARLCKKISEMDIAPRVAGLCLQQRQKAAKVERKAFVAPPRNRIQTASQGLASPKPRLRKLAG